MEISEITMAIAMEKCLDMTNLKTMVGYTVYLIYLLSYL